MLSNAIELVGYGHADRFADYLAEKVLVENLKQDSQAKVACEVMVTRDIIFLGGEITSEAKIDYEKLVYEAIELVYGEKWWPNYFKNVEVINNIKKQSPELNLLQQDEIVAGDQGIIYGLYEPYRFLIIEELKKIITKIKLIFDFSPDWKLLLIDSNFSISVCGITKDNFLNLKKMFQNEFKNSKYFVFINNIIINPAGEWLIGGPLSDTGLTGRKLMIDTFGAGIPHGGGAFCGKDFSKVDKSGIILASQYAKAYCDKHNLTKMNVELTYKIGDSIPIVKYYVGSQWKEDQTIIEQKPISKWLEKMQFANYDWAKFILMDEHWIKLFLN